MKTIVVIPTYNEKDNVGVLIEKLKQLYEDIKVLVVDDNSSDGTAQIIDQLAARDSNVFVMHRAIRTGIGDAYRDGFKKALEFDVDYIVQMDADFSHSPEYISEFLKEIKDFSVIIGSRYISGGGIQDWSFFRRLLSKSGAIYVRLVTGIRLNDPLGGFKCFQREVIEEFLNKERCIAKGFLFSLEVNLFCQKRGYRIAEVPIVFSERKKGSSKISFKIISEAFFKVYLLRLSK